MLCYPIKIYTDHTALIQLFKGKNVSGCLVSCFITIDKFNLVIKSLPGRDNHVPDALSLNVAVLPVTEINSFSLQDLVVATSADPVSSAVIYAIEAGDGVNLPQLPVLPSQFDISNDIHCRLSSWCLVKMPLNLQFQSPLPLLSCTLCTMLLKRDTQVVRKP